MRIDQLPIASAIENTDTLPFSDGGITKQISVGNLTNSIRDNVYGAPLTASTSSAMTDTSRVYVYTGTTGGGFTNGHWYYYNGSAWTDGGVYNSSAVQTDTTLTLAGVPADAKATGELKAVIDDKLASFDVAIETFYPHSGGVGSFVTVAGTVDAPPAGLTIYGRSVQDGTPAPDAPVDIVTAGSGGTLSMVSAAKNLLRRFVSTSGTGTGCSWTFDAETGTYTLTSTVGSNKDKVVYDSEIVVRNAAGQTLTLSAESITGDSNASVRIFLGNPKLGGRQLAMVYGSTLSTTFQVPNEEPLYMVLRMGNTTAAGVTAILKGVQLEVGSARTDFAPMLDKLTAAIPTPNGLPGIPVTSGGNYTDTSGQQWLCDTIDLEAGTWTKRCGIINSYNGETLPGVWLSSMDVYQSGATPTSGAKVVYALAAPEVVQLTTAQLTALRSLRGRKGQTNLYSADPAGPEFRAEMYIDIMTYINSIINQRG